MAWVFIGYLSCDLSGDLDSRAYTLPLLGGFQRWIGQQLAIALECVHLSAAGAVAGAPGMMFGRPASLWGLVSPSNLLSLFWGVLTFCTAVWFGIELVNCFVPRWGEERNQRVFGKRVG